MAAAQHVTPQRRWGKAGRMRKLAMVVELSLTQALAIQVEKAPKRSW